MQDICWSCDKQTKNLKSDGEEWLCLPCYEEKKEAEAKDVKRRDD